MILCVLLCLASCDGGGATKANQPPATKTEQPPTTSTDTPPARSADAPAVAIPPGTGWFCYTETAPGGDGICLRPDDRDICEETVTDRAVGGKPRGLCQPAAKAVCMAFREKMKGNELETWCYPSRAVCDAYKQRYASQPDNYSGFSDCIDAE